MGHTVETSTIETVSKKRVRKQRSTTEGVEQGTGQRRKRASPFTSELQRKCFEEFYSTYPRKVGVSRAERSYIAKVKSTKKHKTIMEALKAQIPFLLRSGIEYVPYPASWLNGERWMDETEGTITPLKQPHKCPKCDNLGFAGTGPWEWCDCPIGQRTRLDWPTSLEEANQALEEGRL